MPPVRNPERLTKGQLKEELTKHGVELPDSSALKSVYIKLYKDKVQKKVRFSGFSSEEEEEEELPDSRITRSAVKEPSEVRVKLERIDLTTARKMMVGDVFVSELSDEQLRDELEAKGVSVGPVVDSTRRLYERKLEMLLKVAGTGDAKSANESQEYSDQEEEEEDEEDEEIDVEESTPVQTRNRRSLLRSSDRDEGAIRRRAMRPREETRQEIKGVRQVDETPVPSSGEKIIPVKSERRWIPVWVAILAVVFIVAFLYLVVTAMESNPRKKLPQN